MDGIELARQAAAELHSQAVGKGLDPWEPYAFVVGAASQLRNLDVEATAPGAAVLNNSRATLVAVDRLILHEKTGTPFQEAFLVGHEIGHEVLGDDSDDEHAYEFDPARAAEPSPTGTDRVVGYGRRQRREVQMDLFARELILPRSVARRLHLEGNMTAAAIAARLGAPFEVVAQQLFDALLLPPIESISTEDGIDRRLNQLQDAAATSNGSCYLLEAGPGTGKTRTLTARVEHLLRQDVDARRILVLTFSNKAAGELSERIAHKHKDGAAAMWIGTFHAFGLDLIRRFHSELGLPKDPQMMDRTEAVELLEEEFARLGLVHYRNFYDPTQIIADMLGAISRAKDEVVDAPRYAVLADAMCQKAATAEDREAAERAMEVARVYEAYEKLKRGRNRIDFGDLVLLPVQLLESNSAVREHLKGQYDHVLVDEYQDVNRSSIRLLGALCDGPNLWAVGDPKQSIYRFRGASSFNMARFGKEDFAGATRGRLKRNYRSVTELVDAFSAFAVGMKVGDADSGLEAERGPSGQQPELRTVDRKEPQAVALAEAIEEMRSGGHQYRDQAILCTGNDKLSELGHDLERLGVPVLFLGSLFERSEIKDLLSLLTILSDRRAMGLVRVACSPIVDVSIADVSGILDHLRNADAAPAEWLRNLDRIADLSENGRSSLVKLAAMLAGFDQAAAPWTVLATVLLDRTRMAAQIATSTHVEERARGIAIWQLLNFLRVQPGGSGFPITRLLERIRRLVRLGDDRELRQLPAAAQGIDAVRLMTIHGAKGLEFNVVHITGMNADTLPRTPQKPSCLAPDGLVEGGQGSGLDVFFEGQAEEQECLFFVGLSRARDRLFLYAPTQAANGRTRKVSPFLDRMGSGLVRRHVNPARALPPAPEARDIALAIAGPLQFNAGQIALYQSCPRRFFYTHILQIGGRRAETAFMQMHEAVRSVVLEIVAGTAPVDGATIERKVDEALVAQRLGDHGYLADFRNYSLTLVRYFASTRDGHTAEARTALSLAIDGVQITILPDDVLVGPDGRRRLRRIKTGHHRAAESDDVGAAAFVLAAREAIPDAVVELVHLSDQEVRLIPLSDRQLKSRREKLAQLLADIRKGRFPAAPSPRSCPNCPAFFVCGATPDGILKKSY